MITPLVRSDQGVTVIGGGAVTADDLDEALAVAPTLVAADGGADRALEIGRIPDWVIGDLDSISASVRHSISAQRVVHIPEQDSTDFSKCLTRIAAPFVVATGFAGLRLDHTLAALTVMAHGHGNIPRLIMLAPDDVVFLAPPEIDLPLAKGTRFSLFPMGPSQGTSKGLEWPIEGITFSPAGRVGTSNRVTGPVHLTITGKMLVMLPRDGFQTVLTALGVAT